MKGIMHAVAGVIGLLCVTTFLISTIASELLGDPETIAMVKKAVFWGVFVMAGSLMGAGATGVSLLGKREEPLASVKQKRGPIAFMTTVFVLGPSAYFLSSRASEYLFDVWFWGVQTIEFAASAVCVVMISLNIRDGLALRGRISAAGSSGMGIEERNGGPLVVQQIPALIGSDGEALPNKSVMALCRCGASKNKPFCDGSHSLIGFDSTPQTDHSKDEVLIYEGEEITIHYNRLLCSHAAECGRRQKAAFDTTRKPWIVPDNAPADDLKEVVKICPSGALRFSAPGGTPAHTQPDIKGITVEKDGPYRVTGVPLASERLAEGANPEKFVLCRCGASKNKPYCDGSHYDIGWTDSPS